MTGALAGPHSTIACRGPIIVLMPLTRRQALLLLASLAAPRAARGQQPATTASAPSLPPARARAVGDRCDALIARAVRSPYGWGWTEVEAGDGLTRAGAVKGKPVPVDALLTARAGLLLNLSGRLTGQAAYRAAAVEAARGLSALQTRSGQVRVKGVMGVFAARDEPGDVPDRRPTRVALALMLDLIDAAAGDAPPDPRLKGPAQRAAHWLGGQQTQAGGWPSLYPPDAPKGRAVRLLRLDERDLRDTALAVLLAGNVFEDRQLEGYFDRAADHLIAIRIFAGRPPGKALWSTAYRLDGDASTREPGLPVCADLAATRHATEVLLAGYLLTMRGKFDVPLKEVHDALAALPRVPGGGWGRRYDLELKPMGGPASQPSGTFEPPAAVAKLVEPLTAELFRRLDRVQQVGAKRTRDEMEAVMPLRRRIVLMLGGLSDDLLVNDPDPARVGRKPELAGTGGLAEALDALWVDLQGERG
jgi:hypothetical protein